MKTKGKYFLAVAMFSFLALLAPPSGRGETLSWQGPTTYVDNAAIAPADQAKIVVHLSADGVEFAAAPPGATSWRGTLPAAKGVTKTYTAVAELNGLRSSASPGVAYTVPFVAPASLKGLTISP